MNKPTLAIGVILITLFITSALIRIQLRPQSTPPQVQPRCIKLPLPHTKSTLSIEEAIHQRRSHRVYKNGALTLQQIAQLLWATQGITSTTGLRASPSAGALYPLEIYLVADHVTDLPAGIYHYIPKKHALSLIAVGSHKKHFIRTSPYQPMVLQQGQAYIIITAIYQRTMAKYGKRGKRYVDMEAGHAAENLSLQAVSLNLGTVPIGAFKTSTVKSLLHLPRQTEPLYI